MYQYTAYGLHFNSDISLPECIPATVDVPDFSIRIADFPVPELNPVNVQRGGIQAQCLVDSDGYWYYHWEGVATYRAFNGKLLEVMFYTQEASRMSLFTICEALGMILMQRGMYLLHASAIEVNGKALVFMAAPGTGKSTTSMAFVKSGCPLLSDDLTAITFDEDGQPWVQPGYPQLKIWEASVEGLEIPKDGLKNVAEGTRKFAFNPGSVFADQPVKLGALYFLDRARNRVAMEQLPPARIPTETLKHFSLGKEFCQNQNLITLFNQSILCARTTPAWRLRRPNGFEALEAWVKTVIRQEPVTI